MKNICNLEMGDLKGGYVFRIRKTQADNRLLLNMYRATFEKCLLARLLLQIRAKKKI